MNFLRADDRISWPQATGPDDAPFHWLPYLLSFLRRRWHWVAVSAAACVAMALMYAVVATPQFTSSSQLLVDIRRADLLSQQHSTQDAQTLNSELESRVEILRSEGLARKVVEQLDLVHDPLVGWSDDGVLSWIRDRIAFLHSAGTSSNADSPVNKAATHLMAMTSVRRIGLTYVIDISVTSPNAIESARLANALVGAYMADQIGVQDDISRQAGDWLQERLIKLRDQATAAGMAVERYKAERNIVDTARGLLNEQQLAELSSQLVSAHERTSAAKALLDRVRAIRKDNVVEAGMSDDLKSPIINTLRASYLDDKARVIQWTARFGADNTQVAKLQSEMKAIEASIRSELDRIAAGYESDYDVARSQEIALNARLNAAVDLTAKTNGDRVELTSLQSSATTYRSVYENFLTRYTQAVQDESFPVSEARVITVAQPPNRKSAPMTMLLLAVGGVFGLGFGLLLAFAVETLDRTLRGKDQLRAATGLLCFGHFPKVRAATFVKRRGILVSAGDHAVTHRDRSLRVVVDEPRSAFARAMRTLRIRLDRTAFHDRHARAIGFVGGRPGDGCSAIAANFAQFLAHAGHRTVLLDWNFDQGELSAGLAPSGADGFVDTLSLSRSLRDVTLRDAETGLNFVPSGKYRGTGSSMRSSSAQVKEIVADLLARYEYVIVDLPPISPSVEAHTIANLLDAFVLVVGWGRTNQDALVDAMLHSGLDDTKFVGAVFSDVNFRSLRKYSAGGELPVAA
jgi:polysaccharide biosynthesis transport protein